MAISSSNNTMNGAIFDDHNAINHNALGKPIGNDKLLSISNIAEILGVCPVTASMVMKDSGRSITIGRRVYILESNFLAFLHEKEG